MRIWPLSVVLALLILTASVLQKLNAQTTSSGALAGVVTDQTGAVIVEAEVEIRDNSKGTTQSTRTDREGAYQFFFVAPGRYTLTVTHTGFREEKRTVNVLLGLSVSVNITLAIAQARNEITVADEVPLIQAENGDASATMNQKQISEVPNPGNDLTYIVQTTPGVVMNTDVSGSNFSILGMPSGSYLYSIDGVDNPPIGALGLLLGQNQVQEATVISTGYSGQFGNAAGGNINYITKSGSNQFHGNMQYYWNGRVLNANDWFNKNSELSNGMPNRAPFDIANQWAASFGGPLRKERLFFFFDTEGLRVLVPQINRVLIPSPQFEDATIKNIDFRFGATSASHTFYRRLFDLYNAAPGARSASPGSFDSNDLGCEGLPILGAGFPCVMHFIEPRGSPSQDALTALRVDWNLGRSDRIFFRVQHDAGHVTVNVNPIASFLDNKARTTWWEEQAIETHTFGSSTASQLVLSYSHSYAFFGVDDLAQALDAFPTHIIPPDQIFDVGNSSFQYRGPSAQYQISEDIVKTGRSHKWGFGMNLVREQSNGKISPDVGLVIPQTLDAFYQGGADPNSLTRDFTVASQFFLSILSQPTVSYHLGIYAQDEWRARPNLSVTLALRAEHQSNLVCQTRCFARPVGPFNAVTHDPSQPYNKTILANQNHAFQSLDKIFWLPRFSFAWQPLGLKHNMVLRGGIGIFYDSVVDSIGWHFFYNPPLANLFTVTGDVLTPDETGSLLSKAEASNTTFVNAFSSGQTLLQIQNSVTDFSPPAITAAEKQTHAPQYQRWSLQLQQAFGAGTSVSVGYFGHHGIHELVQNPNANAWGFGSLPAGRCNDPIPDCAPDPRFSGVTEWDTKAISNYHGMVVSFQHRFSRVSQGLFQANYTFSHALDEVSNGGTGSFSNGARLPFSITPQDPNNLRGAYGSADYDVRHSFNASYIWELPVNAVLGGRGPHSLVKGWQVSGTLFWRTGLPYTVLDIFPPPDLVRQNYSSLLYGVPVRPLGASPRCGRGAVFPPATHPCLPIETLPDWVTPGPDALFVQAGCETGFDSGRLGASGVCDGPTVSFSQGRNRFRGPHYFNTDFTIMKKIEIPRWEGATFGIGLQFFNFLNHPNFGFPVTGLGPPTGMIFYLQQPPTGILGNGNGGFGPVMAPRMIQLKAELKF
jgi:hypothetical protein